MLASSGVDYGPLEQTLFSRRRIHALSTIVVGAGALGTEVVRLLGLLGPAQVTVVDPDCVEQGNLTRSFLFCPGDSIGRNKASAVVAAASALFPQTRWVAEPTEIASVGYQRMAGSDILFSCVDSDLARVEIAYIAKQLGLLVADGGLGRGDHSFGRVSLFPGTVESACFGCFLGPRRRSELLATWHSTIRSCTDPRADDPDADASTPTMAAIVAAMQVEAGIRHVVESRGDTPVRSNTIEIRLHPQAGITEFTTEASVACPFHGSDRDMRRAMAGPDATFGDLLISTGAACIVLDWPICVNARCLDCGRVWSPNLRLATLRRRGRCPGCGSPRVLELETLRSIDAESPWARVPPTSLGLPAEHLHRLQFGPARS